MIRAVVARLPGLLFHPFLIRRRYGLWLPLRAFLFPCVPLESLYLQGFKEYPRQESNLNLRFRKPLFYPLNYGGGLVRRAWITCACGTGKSLVVLQGAEFRRGSEALGGKDPGVAVEVMGNEAGGGEAEAVAGTEEFHAAQGGGGPGAGGPGAMPPTPTSSEG